jgi:hypothetical protein
MPSNRSGFIFSRPMQGDVSSERGSRTIRFITIAGTETEARSTLSRFFHEKTEPELDRTRSHKRTRHGPRTEP